MQGYPHSFSDEGLQNLVHHVEPINIPYLSVGSDRKRSVVDSRHYVTGDREFRKMETESANVEQMWKGVLCRELGQKCLQQQQLLTYVITYLHTYLHTYLLTYLLTYILNCLLTYLLTYVLTYILTYLLIYNYFLTQFFIYLLNTQLLNYLLTYILRHLLN